MSEKSSNLRVLGEVAAALGVILGLIFVIVEIRANTAVATAEARREASAENIEFLMQVALDPDLNRLWQADWTEEYYESLNPEDQHRVFMTAIAVTLRLETVYLQWKLGVLDSASFGSYGMVQPKLKDPYFRSFWCDTYADLVDPEFREYFERVNRYDDCPMADAP